MKLHKGTGKKRIIAIVGMLIVVGIFSLVFFIYSSLRNISLAESFNANVETERNYHVVIIGNSENISFLSEVYEGAEEVSERYRTKVELYVPESHAEDISFQALLDYAAFTNADGVIAYIDSDLESIDYPVRYDGTQIPLVTTGHYAPGLNQISFIGHNYSEVGRKIAQEAVALLNYKGSIFVINSSSNYNTNYSTLMNSLQNVMRHQSGIEFNILDEEDGENIVELSKIIFSKMNENLLLICLTESDIIHACQIVAELNAADKVKIIGLGGNDVIQLYLERGILTELINVNPKKIGERALMELFEYRNKGYANSYVSAEVSIRKQSDEN